MAFTLPPALQEKIGNVRQTVLPLWHRARQQVGAAVSSEADGGGKMASSLAMPAMVQDTVRKVLDALNPAANKTLGSVFRHICVVGLNKTELLLGGENQPITAQSWQEVTDDTMRKHLAMVFFAPRGLDGQPVNPYYFLTEEGAPAAGENDDELDSLSMAEGQLSGFSLLDFCRMSPAAPNTLNIVVVADILFHWDSKDNYILPTSPTSWVRDVEQVLKSYPRTTQANLYTSWDTDLLPPSDRVTVAKLRDIPLDTATWINQPTLQEALGPQVLTLGILLAGLMGGLLWFQHGKLAALEEDVRTIEQQMPKEARFVELNRAITELERMLTPREIFFLAVKDAARAIELAGVKFDNFEVRTPDANEAPRQLLITVETAKNAYSGWIEEEPVAKSLLLSSALMDGIRKPPSTVFRLEALVNIPPAQQYYRQLMQGKALTATGGGYTTAAKLFAEQEAQQKVAEETPTQQPQANNASPDAAEGEDVP